jgi:Zn-dependent protease with chaperone function
MYRIFVWISALLIAGVLSIPALFAQGQEGAAEQKREQQADAMARQNVGQEPHMAAALQHLRQAEEELEKATPNKGGHRAEALELTKKAEAQVEQGIQFYKEHAGKPQPMK